MKEQNKQERKVRSREKRDEDQLRMFELKQQKKREKHKGHLCLLAFARSSVGRPYCVV